MAEATDVPPLIGLHYVAKVIFIDVTPLIRSLSSLEKETLPWYL